jgi:hypothetical protein
VFINRTPSDLLAVAAGIAGGALGHRAFQWLASQGFYGLILPGALVGIAAGFVRHRSWGVAVSCTFIALTAGVLTEYHYAPFIADASLTYFLRHLANLRGLTLLLIAGGAAIGFWGPFRSRVRREAPSSQ